MKKIYLFILLFLYFYFSQNTYGAIIANNILLTGSVEQQYIDGSVGNLVFPNDASIGVKILTNTYNLETGNGDMGITGNFWLKILSDTNNNKSGWITFDIGDVFFNGTSGNKVPKVTLKNNGDNTFLFEGYARSYASGWIYFGDTGINNGKVIYNRTTGKINGCGWSQNIGWLCLDNILLDTTPPKNYEIIVKPFAANNSKTLEFIINDNIGTIEMENYNSEGKTTYLGNKIINHNFQKAKDYDYIITDITGNISDTMTLKVVANVPDTQLTSTINTSKIGDGYQEHSINFILKDEYGNIIKNEDGIKDIEVEIGFNNNVDKNQLENNDFGNAIIYSSSCFSLSNISNTGSCYKNDGKYDIYIKSLAPTTSGYIYTTEDNDINLETLLIKVSALNGNTGVGEGESNINTIENNKFKFTPVVKITSISNSDNFNLNRDVESTFTGNISIEKDINNNINIINLYIHHKLDTIDLNNESINKNINLSFQDISSTNGEEVCVGYLKPNNNNTEFYYYYSNNNNNCSPSNYSNILKSYNGVFENNIDFEDGFKATPKIVIPGETNFNVKYNSEISYKIGSDEIKHPSYNQIYENLTNNQIKISGIANVSNNNLSVVLDNNNDYIGNLTKSEIYMQIKKNVVKYKNIGDGEKINGVYYTNENYSLPDNWENGVDTIIVDGGDLFINNNIEKVEGKVKVIIALKKDNKNGGNIYINKNVQYIGATLITDKSIISGDGNIYYSDNGIAKNQLFIKGSIISYNTIGASSLGIPKCPYYINSCDYQTSKRYDFNNFRVYPGSGGNPVTYSYFDSTKEGYSNSPMIIEYDPDIGINIPKILINN